MNQRYLRRAVTALLMTAVAASAGCRAGEPSSSVTMRDSAGIRIVENYGTARAEPAWGIPPEPVFRIGWGEGEPQLEEVATGVVFPDGRIAIGDRGSQLIRILSAAGEVLETFGGEGDGPGEFTRLSTIVRLGGDTLLAQQSFNPLLCVFVGAELVRTGRFENLIGGGLYGILGRTREGDFALWSTQGYMVRGSRPPPAGSGSRCSDPPPTHPPRHARRCGHGPRPRTGEREPDPGLGLGDDGGRADRPRDQRPPPGHLDRRQGGVVQISRWDQNPEEPTAEDWAAYEGRFREQFADRVHVLDITEDVALVVEYDELDVQAVALYRIEKPGD